MIRVLILDHSRLHCQGLTRILEETGCLAVVGACAPAPESLGRILELKPDIVLLHLGVPDRFAAIRAVVESAPKARVVVLGASESEEEVVACAEAGAAGYLMRDGSLDDLVAIAQSVARGETVCSPRVAAILLRQVAVLASERQSRMLSIRLTAREREIVDLIDRGLSNKEISQQLSVEVRTVKTHVHNILEKLQVHRRGEAAAWVREVRTGSLGVARVGSQRI